MWNLRESVRRVQDWMQQVVMIWVLVPLGFINRSRSCYVTQASDQGTHEIVINFIILVCVHFCRFNKLIANPRRSLKGYFKLALLAIADLVGGKYYTVIYLTPPIDRSEFYCKKKWKRINFSFHITRRDDQS